MQVTNIDDDGDGDNFACNSLNKIYLLLFKRFEDHATD